MLTAGRRRRPRTVPAIMVGMVDREVDGRKSDELRSAQWYAGDDRNAYIHRAWMRRGVPGDAFAAARRSRSPTPPRT